MSKLEFDFTKDDYLYSTAPFEVVLQEPNKFKQEQLKNVLKEKARTVGVGNFVTLLKAYQQITRQEAGVTDDLTTNFDGQPMELKSGSWLCDEYGVATTDKYGFEIIACNHAIMPTQRLVNIDTGIEKLKVSYKKGRAWRSVIIDKDVLASANKIVSLANFGIAVNSENAKYLVRYLTDIEHLNYDELDEVNSVARLGWVDDCGFAPYVDRLVFDGDLSFKTFFESVKEKGDLVKWVEIAKECRQHGTIAKIMLASAFASVLIEPCNFLPFFVHLWGGTEAGKTVALMLAASVWADPALGKYIHTFNSTVVAQELSAGFVNNLPLILDELQIQKDKKDFDTLIYQLSEGVGKARGQKTGGLQRTPTWKNCILTNGEYPISTAKSGGGVVNRIIEVDCKGSKIFAEPVKVADTLRKNYGFAGKLFVEWLQDGKNLALAIKIQKEIYKEIEATPTTEKQAAACSLILTADKLITDLFFDGNDGLTLEDISVYLSTKDEVSQNERAYDFILDFVAINSNKFVANYYGEYLGEIWGKDSGNEIYIIKSKFDQIMSENSFNAIAFLSWAKQKGLLVADNESRNTKVTKIAGKSTRCICINTENFCEVPQMENFEEIFID